MRRGVWIDRGWFGVRAGRVYASVRGPQHRPLFSERNRIGCRVVPLGFGWRFVIVGHVLARRAAALPENARPGETT